MENNCSIDSLSDEDKEGNVENWWKSKNRHWIENKLIEDVFQLVYSLVSSIFLVLGSRFYSQLSHGQALENNWMANNEGNQSELVSLNLFVFEICLFLFSGFYDFLLLMEFRFDLLAPLRRLKGFSIDSTVSTSFTSCSWRSLISSSMGG